jgi:hypothetical protein
MAVDLLQRKSTGLTPAHDRLLDILAEHLVETYLKEIEARPELEEYHTDARS